MRHSTLSILVILISFILIVFMHEMAHIQINEHCGAESKLRIFKYFPSIAVEIESIDYDVWGDDCRLAHNINEVIGYVAQILVLFLGSMFFLIIKLIESKLK